METTSYTSNNRKEQGSDEGEMVAAGGQIYIINTNLFDPTAEKKKKDNHSRGAVQM